MRKGRFDIPDPARLENVGLRPPLLEIRLQRFCHPSFFGLHLFLPLPTFFSPGYTNNSSRVSHLWALARFLIHRVTA